MFDEQSILNELQFKAVRSSGAGGQHVNKTSSKVELTFDLENSQFLTDTQKNLLKSNLQNRLSKAYILNLQCGESRSQHQNKSMIIKRFLELLKDNLVEEKERIPTKTPKAAKRRRLKNKRITSEKKANRKPHDL